MADVGRPSSFDETIAAEICDLLAMDNSLVSICAREGMPSLTTVYRWKDTNDEFRANYARARNDQGHTAADAVGDIRKKILTGELDANVGTAAANLAKWEASRRAARDFGDKLDLTSAGDKLNDPVDLTSMAVKAAAMIRQALERDESE